MKSLHLLCFALSLASCTTTTEPELYDPTGTWAMTGRWGAGTCGVTDPFDQPIVVTESRDSFLATTGDPHETTNGTVLRDENSATIALTILNSDVLLDGGSVRATVLVNATAGETFRITGNGSISLTGGTACRQDFTLTGDLR